MTTRPSTGTPQRSFLLHRHKHTQVVAGCEIAHARDARLQEEVEVEHTPLMTQEDQAEVVVVRDIVQQVREMELVIVVVVLIL